MKKDPVVFLGHILDSIELIESYSKGKTELDFPSATYEPYLRLMGVSVTSCCSRRQPGHPHRLRHSPVSREFVEENSCLLG